MIYVSLCGCGIRDQIEGECVVEDRDRVWRNLLHDLLPVLLVRVRGPHPHYHLNAGIGGLSSVFGEGLQVQLPLERVAGGPRRERAPVLGG